MKQYLTLHIIKSTYNCVIWIIHGTCSGQWGRIFPQEETSPAQRVVLSVSVLNQFMASPYNATPRAHTSCRIVNLEVRGFCFSPFVWLSCISYEDKPEGTIPLVLQLWTTHWIHLNRNYYVNLFYLFSPNFWDLGILKNTHVLLQTIEPSFYQWPFLRERSQKLLWSKHHFWAALVSSVFKGSYSDVYWPETLKFGMRLFSEWNTNTFIHIVPTIWTQPMFMSWDNFNSIIKIILIYFVKSKGREKWST